MIPPPWPETPKTVTKQYLAEALEFIMFTLADLTSAVAEIRAKATDIDTKVDALIDALEEIRTDPSTRLSSEDQSRLDAAVTDLRGSRDALTEQLSQVEAANPPPPGAP